MDYITETFLSIYSLSNKKTLKQAFAFITTIYFFTNLLAAMLGYNMAMESMAGNEINFDLIKLLLISPMFLIVVLSLIILIIKRQKTIIGISLFALLIFFGFIFTKSLLLALLCLIPITMLDEYNPKPKNKDEYYFLPKD